MVAILCLAIVATGHLAPLAAESPDSDPDQVLVPGGRVAVSRLVGGIEQDPAHFLSNLSLRLLEERVTRQGWKHHLHRWRVVSFIDSLATIRNEFGDRIELSLETSESRARVRDFYEALGYRMRGLSSRKGARLEQPESEEASNRRMVAWAMQWDMTGILQQLEQGSSIILEISPEPVSSPITLAQWSGIVGHNVTPENALRALAKDENVGWTFEGLAAVSRQTRQCLMPHLRWIRNSAGRRLARYGSALVVVGDRVVHPAGEEVLSSWQQELQVSPDACGEFIRALLDPDRDEGLIYRWHEQFHQFEPADSGSATGALEQRLALESPVVVRAIDELTFLSESSRQAYFETIEALENRPRARGTFAVITTFEGGIEFLRLLARAGKTEPSSLAELFDEWTRLHRKDSAFDEVTIAQLRWLRKLSATLPEAGPAFPGRGPHEQRLLSAISLRRDPEEFSYRQLPYQGRRSRDLARIMADHLVVHDVPGLDQIFEASQQLNNAAGAARNGDMDQTRHWAKQAAGSVRAISTYEPPVSGFDPGLESFVRDQRRSHLLQFLAEIKIGLRKGRLSKLAERLTRAQAALGVPLRHFLTGLCYVSAVDEMENFLFEERRLIHRHTPLRVFGTRQRRRREKENIWHGASIVSSRESMIGVRVAGHLHDVGKVLGTFARLPGEPFSGGIFASPTRKSDFLYSAVNTRWEQITPETARAATGLMAAGRAALKQALEIHRREEQDLPAEFFRWFPAARLDDLVAASDGQGLVSPSELFLLGAIAAEHASAGTSVAPLEGAVPLAREAIGPLGDSWRTQIGYIVAGADGTFPPEDPWLALRKPYELLVGARVPEQLHARELIDLRLQLIPFLADRELPGRVGGDLLNTLLLENDDSLSKLAGYNWRGTLALVTRFDEDDFEQGMKRCLAKGFYKLQL